MISKDLINKYNVAGPRYTSYPPATCFTNDFDEEGYVRLLGDSNSGKPQNISFYVHVPFCPRICHFCGCNTNIYRDEETVNRYFNALVREFDAVSGYIEAGREVTQIHWGGGTPNSVPFPRIERIMNRIKSNFSVNPNAEIALECSPAYMDLEDLPCLRGIGFNRISIGVQDFNPEVLRRLNRIPSRHPVEKICRAARKAGFKGINLDLIYGLPGQRYQDFMASVRRAIEISPDRLVTFSYAHVPWFKPHQKKLEKYHIPEADEKIEMLVDSFKLLTASGYRAIGMDHYARPDDELYVALKRNELHRNFQGYCTRETTGQVYAFGATAISQLAGGYSQNARSLEDYMGVIAGGRLPVMRGYRLNSREKIIRRVINEVMCNHFMDFEIISSESGISVEELKEILEFNPEKLKPFIQDGLMEYEGDRLKVNPKGFFLIRNIAMALDPALEDKDGRYSKTI